MFYMPITINNNSNVLNFTLNENEFCAGENYS
jgi:hypothetical protein